MINNEKVLIQQRTASTIIDDRGHLSVFESDEIGFKVERVYYLYNVPTDEVRGAHAHKSLRQLIFCVNGAVTLNIHDGTKETSILLDDPSKGLKLEPGMWRELKFEKPNSIVIVLASHRYDPNDYIHQYPDFLEWVKTRDKPNSQKDTK